MSLNIFDCHEDMVKSDPEYKKEYEALAFEYVVARALIEARTAAGFTQQDIARKLGITQPAIARIESGKNVSLKTLQRYANAVGRKISLEINPL